MTEQVTEEYAPHDLAQLAEHESALPVRIVREPGAQSSAPEFSSLQSYVLSGTEQAFPILAFSRKRKNATITVQPNQAALPNNTNQFGGLLTWNIDSQLGNIWDTTALGEDITGIGVDLHVVTASGIGPTTQVHLQESGDGVNFVDTGAAPVTITATGNYRLVAQAPLQRYIRLTSTNTGGTTPNFQASAIASATTSVPISSVQQSVKFAKQEQVSNNQGAIVLAPGQLQYSAQPNLYCIPQPLNGAVIVTVVEEWYA